MWSITLPSMCTKQRMTGKPGKPFSPDLTAFDADKQVISGSPITRDITGEEFYSTIYAIRESSLQEGLIWVGANDGARACDAQWR